MGSPNFTPRATKNVGTLQGAESVGPAPPGPGPAQQPQQPQPPSATASSPAGVERRRGGQKAPSLQKEFLVSPTQARARVSTCNQQTCVNFNFIVNFSTLNFLRKTSTVQPKQKYSPPGLQ